jgi:uncharacterized protein (TIGR00255 family)
MTKPLSSMTGYARAEGGAEGFDLGVEIKSLNSRGLDMRMRLPQGFEFREPDLRRLVSERLFRGSITINVTFRRRAEAGSLAINEAALTSVLAALQTVSNRIEASPPTLDGILALGGVLQSRDAELDDAAQEQVTNELLRIARQCLTELEEAREREGAQLLDIISGQLDTIESLTNRADAHPARTREAIMARLAEQIAALTGAAPALSEERLHQEAMLLAAKADIREEIDRLNTHIAAARRLLAEGGPIGRKLDFLAQEFNREANTLCSKSNAVEITAIGLDLKAVIDQLREQVANIE